MEYDVLFGCGTVKCDGVRGAWHCVWRDGVCGGMVCVCGGMVLGRYICRCRVGDRLPLPTGLSPLL